jgi:hypothetical protein
MEDKIAEAIKTLAEAGAEVGESCLHGNICITDRPPFEVNDGDTIIIIKSA